MVVRSEVPLVVKGLRHMSLIIKKHLLTLLGRVYLFIYLLKFLIIIIVNHYHFLPLVVSLDWFIYLLDVNACLKVDLEEEVFIVSHQGFKEGLIICKICVLEKFVYGLIHSSRAWLEHLGKVLSSYEDLQSKVDHYIFYKHSKNNKISILIIY